MDPNQQNPTPEPTPTPAPVHSKKRSKRTIVAIYCLIGPTALLIGGFVLFAFLNLILNAVIPPAPLTGSELFGQDPAWRTILNVLGFLVTAIGFLTWLPGIIVGIVLLATAKPTTPPQV